MSGIWRRVRHHKKYFLVASLAFFVMFWVALIQNMIRYGVHYSYNPWSSALYLSIALLAFVPFLIPLLVGIELVYKRAPTHYWLWVSAFGLTFLIAYYAFSSIAIHLVGFYEDFFSTQYLRQYFGREALFHSFTIIGTAIYIKFRKPSTEPKIISGTLGRKEVTIKAELVHWIEADDHYLKIHTDPSPLVKRSTLEKMAEELKPDFIRIHRKYLVNKDKIVGKERLQRDEFVILSTGEKLKVGRSYSPLDI